MWTIHVAMAVAALLVAVGLFYRFAVVTLFLLFTYVELIDVTNYLNHYYLVSLLLLLFCFLPLSGMWSLDARWFPALRRQTVPTWSVGLLRSQIAIVYVGAALAKVNSDWLLHAQPLGIWLAARQEVPLLGPLLALPWAPLVFSWAGFLHDLLAPLLLLWRRTRRFAYPIVVGFHLATHLLFVIGIFPVLMPLLATAFFDSSWPRHWATTLRQWRTRSRAPSPAIRDDTWQNRRGASMRPLLPLAAVYLLIQVAMPLRAYCYPGNVLWTEQGMRFGWRVMVREKSGAITYRVRTREWIREKHVPPSRYLTAHQEREFSGQPDMIARLAQDIGDDYRMRGFHDVEVRVDAWVSLNGRPSARLIDPAVDLTKVSLGWQNAHWITSEPQSKPLLVSVR